jgi:hypothetical protein
MEILQDMKYGADSIIENNSFTDTISITVKEGQYLYVLDASIVPVASTPAYSSPGTLPSQSPSAAPAESSQSSIGDSGLCKVGRDIPAGEYFLLMNTDENLDMAFYKISGTSIDLFMGSGYFTFFTIVTLEDGDTFELTNAKMCLFEDFLAAFSNPLQMGLMEDGSYIPGMYKAGVTLPAGDYRLEPASGSGYMEILQDTRPTVDSIIENENFSSNLYITLKEGQYLYVSDALIYPA